MARLEAQVMYMTGNLNESVRPLLTSGVLGLLNTPKNGFRIQDGWTWSADNGCFGKGYPGDEGWIGWLASFSPDQISRCLFATAPDVVADWDATLSRSTPWLPQIRALGYPAAIVAQDGCTPDTVPWNEVDVLFIGGSTVWKLGPEAKEVIAAARQRNIPVHVGRVNSQKRFLAFAALGVTSVDGTYIGFGPEKNLPHVLAWVRHHDTHSALFEMENLS